MPLKTWDTKADWDDAYRFGAEGATGHPNTRAEIVLHYHRGVRDAIADRIAAHFENYLGPAAYNKRFVVIGGGFGWTARHLLDRGFTNVVVADTSAYINAEKDNTDESEVRQAIIDVGLDPDVGEGAQKLLDLSWPPGNPTKGPRRDGVPVLNEDISTKEGRAAVRQALGGQPQIVVSEDVCTSLTDAECLDLDADMQAWGGQQQIVHLVTTLEPGGTQDPGYNWKTLEDWQALIPDAIWIEKQTGRVLEVA